MYLIFKIIFKIIKWSMIIGLWIGLYFASLIIKIEIPEGFIKITEEEKEKFHKKNFKVKIPKEDNEYD